MSKSKKKNKPKSARMSLDTRNMIMLTGNPIWKAFAKKDPVSMKSQTSIGLAARKALYALTNADGQFAHFKELLVTAYAGIYLAERGYGEDFMSDFHAALKVTLECHERAINGQGYTLNEREARLVDELLGLHEQQVQMADRAELASAIVESYRQVGAALLQ
jgi:hypothetical protein